MAGESAVVGILRVLLQAETADYVAGVKDAEKTTRSLSRSFGNLARDLSGAKITEKALDVAKALQQVGGVSKLTARELASVSATVTAATDKLTKMGKEVPPEIAKLSAEIQKVNAATPPAAGGVTKLGSAFGKLQSLSPILTVAGLSRPSSARRKPRWRWRSRLSRWPRRPGCRPRRSRDAGGRRVHRHVGRDVESAASSSARRSARAQTRRATPSGRWASVSQTLKTQTPEDQFGRSLPRSRASTTGGTQPPRRRAVRQGLRRHGRRRLGRVLRDGRRRDGHVRRTRSARCKRPATPGTGSSGRAMVGLGEIACASTSCDRQHRSRRRRSASKRRGSPSPRGTGKGYLVAREIGAGEAGRREGPGSVYRRHYPRHDKTWRPTTEIRPIPGSWPRRRPRSRPSMPRSGRASTPRWPSAGTPRKRTPSRST